MKQPPVVKIVPAFAVPFGAAVLPDAEPLNRELKDLFLAREAEGGRYRNPNQNSVQTDELYESHFDLFKWKEPCVQRLQKAITDHVLEMIGMVNQYRRKTVDEFEVYADAWFHITRKNGYFVNHNHPMASWSAVYCVDSGEKPGQPLNDSGVTRFFHPNQAASQYLDPGLLQMTKAPFGFGHQVFKLQAGEILIFPSWLMHEVSPYKGEGTRITVATNYWFRHPKMNVQQGPRVR